MLFKTCSTMLLAVAASALLAGDAQARWWWPRYQRTCPAPASAVVTTPAAPGTAQTGQTSTYQSFSYEPGVPTTTTPRSSRGNEPWRYGDNKASGRYLWNSR